MDSSSIPMMKSPADIMSCGPNGNNLAATAVRSHPIDRMQRVAAVSGGTALDLDAIRRLYGSALAMRLTTERSLASSVGGRLPGMEAHPDSNAMLDALTGNDLSLQFEDFLNIPQHQPDNNTSRVMETGPHAVMEARLAL
uniref:Proteasome maturation protein n=1 Tax=Eucampia antarctica TaxID=49252 RepID=A0A7S2S6V2_9STRA|mmetsp:Transcript_3817/g.3589  ORF Transcript_3817/g.3589 Transcript_3817/m.3589 type:complete len:140 (+) Transcript_3817:85-504(+)|eukprot:CAMPEP_0197832072 /NCGR_PEP_ID=MMETSP1437-20131217/13168_1 /TAXON_ID=49252 ORGANISM="Eucampia antarctica, Strain CCMP1452" /NCGR_SAMPLE_ID=MMETSP1437 /ASSEMBLY_ACC=CAM_ASM_001096 /LENGTH=139 /DNA_ID=CAMNT_0043435253 /DNA_START=84 /DNA_END=503 /DNA_ORIENTATION=+